MQLDLAGKSAFVSGSSKGIGLSIAKLLYEEGCRVALNARNRQELQAAEVALPGAIGIVGDMSIQKEAQRVVSHVVQAFGGLDILVCNVGSGQSVAAGCENFDEWQRVFALNLWSTTNTVEFARGALVVSKGVIVCVSSICGLEVIPGAPLTYSVAKAALNAYVRGIARPFGRQGIRINAIAPGNIIFDGSIWENRLSQDPKFVNDMLEREVPLNCLGSPNDIANLAAYLVSPRSAFVTGRVWTIDGGQVRA
jgi:3-oxoacyl-[acyl-carrier protein] reductase